MFATLVNIIVNIIAAFIPNQEARHKFRNKYKRKSTFRKLLDDNRRLLTENKKFLDENKLIKQDINNIKKNINEVHLDLLKINSFLFASSNVSTEKAPVYLSIACIAFNEGPYLKEWIEYHKIVGVERFYFYDNGSDDNTFELLKPYIKDGVVIYQKVDGLGLHLAAMNDAVCKYRHQTFWMAIIDLDEFLLPVENNSVPSFLKEFEQYPSVGINWVCFDTNGHKTKPTEHGGLVIANYTRVSKDYNIKINRHIKSIVNPRKVKYVKSVHYVICDKGTTVTENFEPVDTFYTKYHSSQKIRINHYITKSEEEFLARGNKKLTNISKEQRVLALKDRFGINQDFEESAFDTVIKKYLPTLKHRLGI